MYIIVTSLLVIIFYILLPIGIGLAIYKITSIISSMKAAKAVTVIYTFVLAWFMLTSIFEEDLFSENDAKELVEEHSFSLNDEIKLAKNHQAAAASEYFHYFNVNVSDNDKSNLIKEIKNSPNFKTVTTPKESLRFKHLHTYTGPEIYQNFETETHYVREYFKPNGKGYAPKFIKFSVSKADTSLEYEEL